ncbi:hypothetical protein ETAA8_06360 [Anatilimnocola aggregata]|uniref:Uncharacterized protein n=1 Tax=Anatilimnocola aggregata TaxID=2528021 RepID=A0A517Y5Q2_9BACT|nr:hypothetical protein [Anatilimnocola aggregata]QDU25567.1 hypothetical protein ETAA8_06360 [Anatilimnocola aggregata]
MESVIASWIGKHVSITLHSTIPTPLDGKLVAIDASGILLQLSYGQTYVPMTSVLHLSPTKDE